MTVDALAAATLASHVVYVGCIENASVALTATSAILTDMPCASSVERTRSARCEIFAPSTLRPTTRTRPSAAVVDMLELVTNSYGQPSIESRNRSAPEPVP